MNLVQQAEQLKFLPDEALSKMTQGMSSTPPYLVAAEMQRRESMRNAFRAQNDPVQQKTVIEEMREKFNPAQPPMPQPPQQNPAAGAGLASPMPGTQPMRMAKGGTIRAAGGLASLMTPQEYENGGGVASLAQYFDEMQGPSVPTQPVPEPQYPGAPPMGTFDDEPAMNRSQLEARYGSAPSIEDVMAVVRKLRGKSRLEGIADELASQEKSYRDKKPSLGNILMHLGLGMAASKRPDFAGAVGEGGLAALHGYTQQREGNLSRADAAMRQRMGLVEAMQQSDDVSTREAGELHRANIAGRNTEIMTGENARQGMQSAKSREKINELTRQSQQEIEGMKEAAAERRYQETFNQNSTEKQKDRDARMAELDREIAGGKWRDHSGNGDGTTAISKAITANVQRISSNEREIIEMQKQAAETMDEATKKVIFSRIEQLRLKNDIARDELQEDINRLRGVKTEPKQPGPPKMTVDQLLNSLPSRGAAQQPAPRDYSKMREAAGSAIAGGLKQASSPPGLQSLIGAAAAAVKRLKEPYSAPHPNY